MLRIPIINKLDNNYRVYLDYANGYEGPIFKVVDKLGYIVIRNFAHWNKVEAEIKEKCKFSSKSAIETLRKSRYIYFELSYLSNCEYIGIMTPDGLRDLLDTLIVLQGSTITSKIIIDLEKQKKIMTELTSRVLLDNRYKILISTKDTIVLQKEYK